jgi:integral membrane protein
MSHGVLFIAYCLWVLIYGIKSEKNGTFFILGWLMSLVPFGTFWFDAKYLKTKI